MHHKRKKSKRRVRCTICTKYRWLGNHKERQPLRDRRQQQQRLNHDR